MDSIELNDEKLEDLIRHQFKKNTFSNSTPIIPEPGFVIKSKITEIKIKPDDLEDPLSDPLSGSMPTQNELAQNVSKLSLYNGNESYNWTVGMKIFCNLCHSLSIPAPPLVSKEEIIKAIKNDDSSTYKVPLSLSKPRSDIAKDGSICIVFDACINSRPYQQSLEDEDFKFFLADLALAWIQEKYSIALSEKYSFPKMIAKGSLVPHMIKRAPRPVISEMKVEHKPRTPSYTIVLEPEENPDYLVVQIHLPLMDSCADAELDLEAKRLIFKGSDIYELDISLAFPVDIETAGASFDCATKYLHTVFPMHNATQSRECGYLGPLGTYSYQAATELFRNKNLENYKEAIAERKHGESIEYVPIQTIPNLFSSHCEFIIAPIENSTSGSVAQTLNSLYSLSLKRMGRVASPLKCADSGNATTEGKVSIYSYHAVDEISIPINHCLMKSEKTDQKEIKKIYSHPEALAQCSLWLQDHYPTAQLIPVSSTAHGAILASADFQSASISNRICADLYGLEIIQDNLAPSVNTTRFLLFQKKLFCESTSSQYELRKNEEYMTLVFHEPKRDQEGLGIETCSSMVPIHRIFSKPVPSHLNLDSSLWCYFYIYLVKGHESDNRIIACIEKLSKVSNMALCLGSFPHAP